MDGIILTPLKQVFNPKGDVLHALKKTDDGFSDFGEAYFSKINCGQIKGWKKHHRMTLNLIVVSGEVEFVLYNCKEFFNVRLSLKNYKRLTVPPGIWLAFRGLENKSILLNIANIEHDPSESENFDLNGFNYNWDDC